jgi:transposase-like protein
MYKKAPKSPQPSQVQPTTGITRKEVGKMNAFPHCTTNSENDNPMDANFLNDPFFQYQNHYVMTGEVSSAHIDTLKSQDEYFHEIVLGKDYSKDQKMRAREVRKQIAKNISIAERRQSKALRYPIIQSDSTPMIVADLWEKIASPERKAASPERKAASPESKAANPERKAAWDLWTKRTRQMLSDGATVVATTVTTTNSEKRLLEKALEGLGKRKDAPTALTHVQELLGEAIENAEELRHLKAIENAEEPHYDIEEEWMEDLKEQLRVDLWESGVENPEKRFRQALKAIEKTKKDSQKLLEEAMKDAKKFRKDVTIDILRKLKRLGYRDKKVRQVAGLLIEAIRILFGDSGNTSKYIQRAMEENALQVIQSFLHMLKVALANSSACSIRGEASTILASYLITLGACVERSLYCKRNPDDPCNGFRTIMIDGVPTAVPETREMYSLPLFENCGSLGERICKTIISLHTRGLSCQSISDFLYEVEGIEISKETVRDRLKPFYEELKKWSKRCLKEYKCFAVIFDGTYDSVDVITCSKTKTRKRQRDRVLLKAIGLYMDEGGIKRVFLGCISADKESAENYNKLVDDLISRGFDSEFVKMIICDRHGSFPVVREKRFRKADLQHCCVHLSRHIRKKIPSHLLKAWAAAFLKSAYWVLLSSTKEEGLERLDFFRAVFGHIMPEAVAYLKENLDSHTNVTKFFSHPEIIQLLLSTNLIESINRLTSRWADWKGGFRSVAEHVRTGCLSGLRMEKISEYALRIDIGPEHLAGPKRIIKWEDAAEDKIDRLEENFVDLVNIISNHGEGCTEEFVDLYNRAVAYKERRCHELSYGNSPDYKLQ